MSGFLPYGRQVIEDDDIEAVIAALKSDYLTTGPAVEAFERTLAETVGAKHAIVCNSGTAALHLAALAMKLGPDDQVIVPTLTFLATANAPRFTGAEIVFADVDPDSGLMTPETFAQALERAPRAHAAFPVHLNGQVCDMAAIKRLADTRGVTLVEDSCHAIGAAYPDGAPIGSCPNAAMAAFSFHPVKSIAMGEGGAITTNDDSLAALCRAYRNHGMNRDAAAFQPESADFAFAPDGAPNPWAYDMAEPGYNYRAPDILCALGLSQLKKLKRFLTRREEIAARYDAGLASFAPLLKPAARQPGVRPGWHLYVALVDFAAAGMPRAEVMQALRARNVGTQVHYVPVHQQPYYRRTTPTPDLTGASAYYERALSLPIYPAMSDADVDHVVEALRDVLGLSNQAKTA